MGVVAPMGSIGGAGVSFVVLIVAAVETAERNRDFRNHDFRSSVSVISNRDGSDFGYTADLERAAEARDDVQLFDLSNLFEAGF